MREAVGCTRLVGVQVYQQLHEVYRVLRLVVNCFQPSMKLQAKVYQGERVHRVYDVAQTPLQRLLASGVLPEDRQQALRERVQQIDPLALSEQLDALRHTLLCGALLSPAVATDEPARSQFDFSLAACPSVPRFLQAKEPERIDQQEVPSSNEEILNEPYSPHHPFIGVLDETMTLFQAHPEWTSTQIQYEIKRLAPERAGTVPMEALIRDIDPIRPPLRVPWGDSGHQNASREDTLSSSQRRRISLKKLSRRLLTLPYRLNCFPHSSQVRRAVPLGNTKPVILP